MREAAKAAHAAGEGAEIRLPLGGRSGPEGVTPLEAAYRVERLGSGKFRTDGSVSGGREVDVGLMALLAIGGVRIAVTSKRLQAYDQAPFRHLGVEPAKQKILALKSTCHYRGEFEPIAEEVIVVLAPGGYLADPARYPYRRLRPGIRLRPLGPEFRGVTLLPVFHGERARVRPDRRCQSPASAGRRRRGRRQRARGGRGLGARRGRVRAARAEGAAGGGSLRGLGGSPSIMPAAELATGSRARGGGEQRPRIGMARGGEDGRAPAQASTMRPRYMMATRSHMRSTTDRSCEMRR